MYLSNVERLPEGFVPEIGAYALPLFHQWNVKEANQSATVDIDVTVSPITSRTRIRTFTGKFQDLILKSPSSSTGNHRKISDPEDEEATGRKSLPLVLDEEIVNFALLDFANALLVHHRLQNKWSSHRVPRTAKFKKASFVARTDGCLQGRATGNILALVEVKPYMRYKSLRLIHMQETAQMAA
ncbi:hypothetical protein BBP40_010657 [Aspergillus hancockii]|nr:hypothetical protein BBP40_010657 [Aspergillus hancockii]